MASRCLTGPEIACRWPGRGISNVVPLRADFPMSVAFFINCICSAIEGSQKRVHRIYSIADTSKHVFSSGLEVVQTLGKLDSILGKLKST